MLQITKLLDPNRRRGPGPISTAFMESSMFKWMGRHYRVGLLLACATSAMVMYFAVSYFRRRAEGEDADVAQKPVLPKTNSSQQILKAGSPNEESNPPYNFNRILDSFPSQKTASSAQSGPSEES